jgi:hypothetical protein
LKTIQIVATNATATSTRSSVWYPPGYEPMKFRPAFVPFTIVSHGHENSRNQPFCALNGVSASPVVIRQYQR